MAKLFTDKIHSICKKQKEGHPEFENTLHVVICALFRILCKTAIDHRTGKSTLAYSSQSPMAKEMTGTWQPPLLPNLHHFCLVDHHFPLLCLLYLLY